MSDNRSPAPATGVKSDAGTVSKTPNPLVAVDPCDTADTVTPISPRLGGMKAQRKEAAVHIQQRHLWSCGISCVQMAVRRFGSPAFDFEEVYRRCPTNQCEIWSIDLGYALARYGMAVRYETVDAGEDPDEFEPASKDEEMQIDGEVLRINHLLVAAPMVGIQINQRDCPMSDIAVFLDQSAHGTTGCVILLVDSSILTCSKCTHPHCLANLYRPCDAICHKIMEFAGHFILLTGVDPDDGDIIYENPAYERGGCRVSQADLDACRTECTDRDVLFVSWDDEMLEKHLEDVEHTEVRGRASNDDSTQIEFWDVLFTVLMCTKKAKWWLLLLMILSSMGVAVQIYMPVLQGDMIDGVLDNNKSFILRILFIMLGLKVWALLLGLIMPYASTKVANAATANIRSRLLNNLLIQEMAYFDDCQVGDLMSILTVDALAINDLLTSTLQPLLHNFAVFVSAVVFISKFDWELMLICAVPTPIIGAISYYAGNVLKGYAFQMQVVYAECTKVIYTSLTEMRLIRSFNGSYEQSQLFSSKQLAWLQHQINVTMITMITGALNGTVSMTIIWMGIMEVLDGDLSLGRFSAIVALTEQVQAAVKALTELYPQMMVQFGQATRVFSTGRRKSQVVTSQCEKCYHEKDSLPKGGADLDLTDEMPSCIRRCLLSCQTNQIQEQELDGTDAHPGDDKADDKEDKPCTHTLSTLENCSFEFRDVKFRYPTRPDKIVLQGCSLTIEHAKTTALVGGSGSGKSTVVQLLLGFYFIDTGDILFGGISVSRLNRAWIRDSIAYVQQEPVLFDTSVYENVALGHQDGKLGSSMERVWECLELANAKQFVADMPDGIWTVVGRSGSNLSAGQKQRLAIARALMRSAPVVIFDEATSALDSKSEHEVQQAIDMALPGRTAVVVAHRLQTIQSADHIVVMKDGSVVEQGTWNALIKQGGHFQKLARLSDNEDKIDEDAPSEDNVKEDEEAPSACCSPLVVTM